MMMMIFPPSRIPLFAFFFLLLLVPSLARSQASDWQTAEQGRVRILSAVTGTGTRPIIPGGLEVELKPNWHTYWRTPGDAGAPPDLQVEASSLNLDHVALLFPVPDRHIQAGLETIGYEGHLVFPIQISPKIIGQPIDMNLKLTLLVCSDICVPNEFKINLKIPAGGDGPSSFDELLKNWQARVPVDDQQAWKITHSQIGDKNSVTLDFVAARALQNPRAFVETKDGGIFQPPEISLDNSHHQGTIKLTLHADAELPNPPQLTVTLADGDHGWEQHIALTPGSAPLVPTTPPLSATPANTDAPSHNSVIPPVVPHSSLLAMLFYAFLGGLILNMMPCVLPVLSLKVLKFMGHGGREDHEARLSFLATSAGIVASFLLLAAILVTLRAVGESVGWGIQFQHPGFLMFLMVVLLVFAGNMWGLFEIQLPSAVNARLLAASAHHPRMLGDFLTGGFAALLATPCTAPYLGTAIGFALGASDFNVVAIFFGMGLGMATPYLLVAISPGIATRMPRPGAWMIKLKRILALALLATAFWLGGILIMQYQAVPGSFDEVALQQQVAQGKTVFVDVTAAWCITCQVNKKLVLDRPDISARLHSPDVIEYVRDWTKPNQSIADYLHRYQRGGIPFNIVYGPGSPEGIVLHEVLTPEAVMEALDKAAKKP